MSSKSYGGLSEISLFNPLPVLCSHVCLLTTLTSDRRGHFQRALEEAVQTHATQWPLIWNGKNPLHGGGNFGKMSAAERVKILNPYRQATGVY